LKRWLGLSGLVWLCLLVGCFGGSTGDGPPAAASSNETGENLAAAKEQERTAEGEGQVDAKRFSDSAGMKLELESVDGISQEKAGDEDGLAGRPAPNLTLPGLDGRTYRLADWRGIKPVVVNFWASWCPPCEMEAPDLVYLYDKYQGQVEFFAVNLTHQDTLSDARAFSERHGYRFPVLLDEKGTAARHWQVISIPTTYFINKDGVIQRTLFGITTRGRLEAYVQKLLEPS